MNAPLSRYLTQFSAPQPAPVAASPMRFETRISLTAVELEARLAEAVAAARSEDEATRASEIDALLAEKEAAAAEALAAARAEWVTSEAEVLATRIVEVVGELRETIADRLAGVLRPILSDALATRTARELNEALDKLLADPDHPAISVRGRADLLEPLQRRRGAAAIEWVVTEACDVTILADATRLETCLGAALLELAVAES